MPQDDIATLEKKIARYERGKKRWLNTFFCPNTFLDEESQFLRQVKLADLYSEMENHDKAYQTLLSTVSVIAYKPFSRRREALARLSDYAIASENEANIEEALLTQVQNQSVLSLNQTAVAFQTLFDFYLRHDEPNKAKVLYQDWVKTDNFKKQGRTSRCEVLITLGDFCLKKKAWEEAFNYFERAKVIADERWSYTYLSKEHQRLYPRLLLVAAVLEKTETNRLTQIVNGLLKRERCDEIRFKGCDRKFNRNHALKLALNVLLERSVLNTEDLPFECERVKREEEVVSIEEETAHERPETQHKDSQEEHEDKPLKEHEKVASKLTDKWETFGVGGYKDTLAKIQQYLLYPRAFPHDIQEKLGKPPTSALFYGPPGTGKTYIATRIGEHFFDEDHVEVIDGPELFSPLVGNSEARLRALFDKAKRNPNETFVYIFDEIESLVGKRSSSDSVGANVGNRLTSTLLPILDGSHSLDNILVIGVTNFKDNLDKALLRSGRMGAQFEIALPNYEDRLAILKVHIEPCIDAGTVDKTLDFEWLAQSTEGFSGADIKELVKRAKGDIYSKLIKFDKAGRAIIANSSDLSGVSVGLRAFQKALLSFKAAEPVLPKANSEKESISKTFRRTLSARF